MKSGGDSILVLCKTLRKGGAEKQAMITAKLLSQHGYPVHIIIWHSNMIDQDNLNYLENQQISCEGLQGSIIYKLRRFRDHIKQNNITVILAYLTLANMVGAFAALCKHQLKTIGGVRSEKLPYVKFLVERVVHNRINSCTVFNSHAAKRGFVKRGFSPSKAVVIHNAIAVRPVIRSTRDEWLTIITVARFIKSKDFPTALKAFRQLADKLPSMKLKFMIVGYGKYEVSIRALIKKYRLTDSVKMVIDPPNVKELLARADIYLSTSLVEGLSNSIMEAMAVGLPVVATDVGDNRYLIEESKNGYIVPCSDVTAIAQKLEQLACSKETRKRFGEYSLDKISSGFTEEVMIDRYIKLIEELK